MTPERADRLTDALTRRYTIEREIGQGGMATVYLARDVRHDRNVALKVLRPELAAVIGADRFLQEIRVTAGLHLLPAHPPGPDDIPELTLAPRQARAPVLTSRNTIRCSSGRALPYQSTHDATH